MLIAKHAHSERSRRNLATVCSDCCLKTEDARKHICAETSSALCLRRHDSAGTVPPGEAFLSSHHSLMP